ncbi:hypothetical protein CXB51_006968 [Gossypium anomalum]|uniref:DUF7745 domain-containing protein n=1 Tax=Gossypium anomalum TaxID=47600 RepID=A0A8J5ZCA8_9ROSI|nr:hypothetical protein CXB51_006968 [Gossypium anomalum]
MESGFIDKLEDNVDVRTWSENKQLEKGDSLAEGCTSKLGNFTRINVTQNELQELRDIWASWDDETKQLFYQGYRDLPYLLNIKFWNPAYSCFTFGNVDLVPTVEEYTALLRCPKVQVDKVYSKAAGAPAFVKKLMSITGTTHPDTKRKVDIFVLSIYGLVIFPKALRHIDEVVADFFDRFDKGVTPVPAILAETFRSLSACRKAGEGRFIGCAQLLLAWFHSHFWKVDKEEDVEWRAPWFVPNEIPYRCGSFDWSEFAYKEKNYKKKVQEIFDAWKQMRWMKRFAVGSMTTIKYKGWLSKRVNDNILEPSLGDKLEAEKLRKGKRKTSEQWRQKIQEEKARADQWEKRFNDARARENALNKSLVEGQDDKKMLVARVAELEKAMHQYRSRNFDIELRASLNRIEDLKGKVEELETTLQNYLRSGRSFTDLSGSGRCARCEICARVRPGSRAGLPS